ncbi:MAG TPA: DUF3885 domain-containing protein, partial [Hymenobacter sp.]
AYSTLSGLYRPGAVLNQEFLRLPAHRIAHRQVLTAVAHEAFPSRAPQRRARRIREAPELYFLNLDRALIFHMYDDRGLDILAADRQTLRPLYEQFHDWLLDYDRPLMKQQMEPDEEKAA